MYRIIAEEADFIVIDKSTRVHFHSQDGTPGVVATVEKDLGCRLYAVHRLDTITSGLLLLAKSSVAANTLSVLFSDHKIQKYYLALAAGKPKKKQGIIAGDMTKSRRGCYKLLRTVTNPAVTQFFSLSLSPGKRIYLLKPLSGKTHQLRVAMNALGTPVLGDSRYGGASADRPYLHAWQLEFSYGTRRYCFEALPRQGTLFACDAFTTCIKRWSQPSDLPWPQSKYFMNKQEVSTR